MNFWNYASNAVDIIILVGALFVAIKNIFGPMIQSTKWFKQKYDKKKNTDIEDLVLKVLNEQVPEYLKEILEQNATQTEKIEAIQKDLADLKESEKDNLRAEINRIYYKYLPYKKIYDYDKRAVMEMFYDYTRLGGNSYIHEVMDDIKEWDVVPNSEKL